MESTSDGWQSCMENITSPSIGVSINITRKLLCCLYSPIGNLTLQESVLLRLPSTWNLSIAKEISVTGKEVNTADPYHQQASPPTAP